MAESAGLMASLKRLAGTLLAIACTRFELLSNEWEEERLRIGQMLLYGLTALFFFGLAILLLTAMIVVLFWDTYPLAVMGALSALFFIAGFLAWNVMRTLSRQKPRLFSASLSELADDRDRLAPRP